MCIAPSWRKWEDVRYSTFLGRCHNSRWTHSPQTRSWNKMAVFWGCFRDFVEAQKIEDLTESKNFFAEVFQISCRFILAKKNWGVRYTLPTIKVPSRDDCGELYLACFAFWGLCKGRFTRYDFLACDKLTTGLRKELFRVNQTYNSLTTVVYVKKMSRDFKTCFKTLRQENDVFCDKFLLSRGRTWSFLASKCWTKLLLTLIHMNSFLETYGTD